MLDTDIEGLDPKTATEYVLAFVSTMKRTETELARYAEEIATWTRRVGLATEKGDASLAEQARAKLAEIEGKKTALLSELTDLRLKVDILKDKLQRLRGRFQRSVDPDVLLAELEMLVGKKDPLADRFKVEEAEAKVAELKKKMAGGTP
jgi:predicted nuclease with TOPRIM domain